MASNILAIIALLPAIAFYYMIPFPEMLKAAYVKVAGKITAL